MGLPGSGTPTGTWARYLGPLGYLRASQEAVVASSPGRSSSNYGCLCLHVRTCPMSRGDHSCQKERCYSSPLSPDHSAPRHPTGENPRGTHRGPSTTQGLQPGSGQLRPPALAPGHDGSLRDSAPPAGHNDSPVFSALSLVTFGAAPRDSAATLSHFSLAAGLNVDSSSPSFN